MDKSHHKSELSIITTIERDWHHLMAQYIDALEKQQDVDCKDIQVTVVNGSGDKNLGEQLIDTQKSYKGNLRLNFYTIDKCGRAAATNYGISRSNASLLLLLADDFIASPNLVIEHVRLHRQNPQENIIGIGPGVFPYDWELSPFMHWLEVSGALFGVAFVGESAQPPLADFFYGANTSLKRSFLEAAGPFDEDYPYDCWDDFEMSLRLRKLGMQARYLPDAVAFHWHQISVLDRGAQMRHAGESAAIMDFKQGGIDRLSIGVKQRRKKRVNKRPQQQEMRWQLLLADEFNKAYKKAAKRLISTKTIRLD